MPRGPHRLEKNSISRGNIEKNQAIQYGMKFSIENVLFHSALLKHAFREVTCGFCKGTVPGCPLAPPQAPKNAQK